MHETPGTRARHAADADTLGGPGAATLLEPASPPASQPEPEPAEEPELRVGSAVGRYIVLEEIGRGGMGRVLRAYDPKLQREVALKEVHGQILGRDGTARLVAEARAMAKLSHANVVAVYDVESLDDGRLALVMEYVPGMTLRTWLTAQPRDARSVIDRFIAAGRGLAAAHAAGLLHRDFKPANVLVGDGDIVKVTDFGLAKLDPGRDSGGRSSWDHLSDQGDLTRSGTVLGTPLYMAPEQHRGETLSAAADQYAFCVALWEALAGEAPFHAAPLVLRKQTGPPAWSGGDAVPRHIAEAIRRGLAPNPEHRWPSVEALLAVLAARTTTRRNRWLLVASALVVAAAALALRAWSASRSDERCTGAEQQLAGVWDDARRTQVREAMLGVEAPYAARVWGLTALGLDRYAQAWIDQHNEACATTVIHGEQSAEVMDLRMACLHRARVDLDAAIDVLAGADATAVANAHELVERLPSLRRCTDVQALRAEVPPPLEAEAEAVEAIRVLVAEARAADEAGRFDVARGKIEAALRDVDTIGYGPVRTEVYAEHGSVLERSGEYEASEARLLEALQLGIAWRQWTAVRDVSAALMFVVGCELQRMDEALRYRELAIGLAEDDLHAEQVARSSLAAVLLVQGKFADARIEAERAIELAIDEVGAEHHDVAEVRVNLVVILNAQGNYAEAEGELRLALASFEKELGPDHILTGTAHYNLGLVLENQTKYEEAEAEHRRALALRLAAHGPDHVSVGESRTGLANVLRQQGELEAAEAEYRRALQILSVLGPEHRDVLIVEANLGATLQAQKRFAEAEQQHRRVVSLYVKLFGPDHPDVAAARIHLGNALQEQDEFVEAEAEYRRALAILEPVLGADHPNVALAQTSVARVLLSLSRPRDALPFAEQAWVHRQQPEVVATQRATTAFVLARALWAATPSSSEQRDRARMLARVALDSLRAAGPTFADDADEVARWLNARRDHGNLDGGLELGL